MEISIVGSGYVGATLAGCLAELGHDITAVDIDADVVRQINAGEPPIVEPGLDALFDEHVGERLRATTNIDRISETDITFLTVQTPPSQDGMMDTRALESACRDVGGALRQKSGYHLVVVKSTVLPGIAEEVLLPAIEEAGDSGQGAEVGLAINPEFQAQGSAVEDFMEPDKLVFGTNDERAKELLSNVYEPLITGADPGVVETGLGEASMIKYANNVFLAAKVSVINELGNIGKEYGVDSYEVAEAMGMDERIGSQFLESGAGWGGSCLPGNEQLFVKDGPVRRMTFEEFFEEYVQEETVSDVSVLSSDMDGNFGFNRVQGATKRKYEGELRTFEIDSGESVSATSDHPMIVVDDDLPTVVEARNIAIGEELPVVSDTSKRRSNVTEPRNGLFELAKPFKNPAASPPYTTAHVSAGSMAGLSIGIPARSKRRPSPGASVAAAGANLGASVRRIIADGAGMGWTDLLGGGRSIRGESGLISQETGPEMDGAVRGTPQADRFETATVRSVATDQASTEVYSIEVADNHTFVTTGGVLVHNCFPKDTAALMAAANQRGYEPDLLREVVAVNDKQPVRMIELLEKHTEIAGARIAVLGAAFKPGTNDTRGTRARPLVETLSERGATPVVYDPTDAAEVIADESKRTELAESARSALDGADGAVVVTDWDEFASLDSEFDLMAEPVVVDGRRIVSRREGLVYEGLTW
jgi:UDP-glucose 6-dehydrogenase